MNTLNTEITGKKYAFVYNGVVFNIGSESDYKKDIEIHGSDSCGVEITSANCDSIVVTYETQDGKEETVTYYLDSYITDGDEYDEANDKFTPNPNHNKNCSGVSLSSYTEIYRHEAIAEIVERISNDESFDTIKESLPLFIAYDVNEEIVGQEYKKIVEIDPANYVVKIDDEELINCALVIATENAVECGNAIANKLNLQVKEDSIEFEEKVD